MTFFRQISFSHQNLGLALGIAGMVTFAATLPARRLGVTALDPLFLSAASATLAGCTALMVLIATRRTLPPRTLWPALFSAGFCSIVAFPILTALAMMTVPAAHGGVVLGIQPLAIAAGAALLAHERPSGGFWLVSAAGAIVVVTFVLRRGGADTVSAGDFFLIAAVIAGAVNYTLYGRLTSLMPGWEVISWSVTIFLPLAAAATFALWPADLANVPYPVWAALGYIGLVSQYTGFFLFNAALAMGGIARVGQVLLLQPFVTLALAAPVNGERIDLETILFAAAVVTTVVIGQRMRVTRG